MRNWFLRPNALTSSGGCRARIGRFQNIRCQEGPGSGLAFQVEQTSGGFPRACCFAVGASGHRFRVEPRARASQSHWCANEASEAPLRAEKVPRCGGAALAHLRLARSAASPGSPRRPRANASRNRSGSSSRYTGHRVSREFGRH
eukprot:scaffold888_cov246-Pinguiococcus_pyrenoidosus.AAC.8